jgi:signal transduction histidine kinase
MTVRFRLALTVFLTGLATALGVIVTVAIAFQRFDSEGAWQRSDAFLSRVTAQHPDLLEQHQRNPEGLTAFLRNLLLYEPDSQLYLLGADGTVLASTGRVQLAPGFKVKLAPVQEAAALAASGNSRQATYVMGDDPEYMQADAVVAARALRTSTIAADAAVGGYLYFVCHKPWLPANQLSLVGSSLASPAIASTLAVIVLSTALAAWIIVAVTRPLRVLSFEVAAAARDGFEAAPAALAAPAGVVDDEFGRLRRGFHTLLATLRRQWDELKRLDHFRRESVSNLSHDLRSPLTATVACLETLEQRWQGHEARSDDRRLVEVALRNTRNAAAMVRSLGDLALLDEPTFRLRRTRLDLGEVLDDIALRFAGRAEQRGVGLRFRQLGTEPLLAEVDVELFERALANLLDNAFKFTPAGGAIEITAQGLGHDVQVRVSDQGSGISAADLPQLFDRHYQSRTSVAPATSEEGRGLGLAIVKRIVELHQGSVSVASQVGRGTDVTLTLPAQAAA